MPKNEAQIDEADLDGLARACARRFPTAEVQRPFARAAGLDADPTDVGDASTNWAKILRAAQSRGRLVDLARALAQAAPGDENLLALARALGVAAAPSTRSPSPLVLGVVGSVILAGAALTWTFSGDSAPVATTSTSTSTSTGTSTGTSEGTPAEPVPLPTVEPAVEPPAAPPDPTPDPKATSTPTSATTSTPPSAVAAASPTPAPRAPSSSPCSGYFYFGRSSPGAAGETITLGRDARVRADYPRADNGHDASAPERCVLTRGTQLVLTREPIDASNGHYWVPVGDP